MTELLEPAVIGPRCPVPRHRITGRVLGDVAHQCQSAPASSHRASGSSRSGGAHSGVSAGTYSPRSSCRGLVIGPQFGREDPVRLIPHGVACASPDDRCAPTTNGAISPVPVTSASTMLR